MRSEGNVRIRAESGWHESQADAIDECQDEVNKKVDRELRRLKRSGYTIAGIEFNAIKTDRRGGDEVKFRAKTSAVIEWVRHEENNEVYEEEKSNFDDSVPIAEPYTIRRTSNSVEAIMGSFFEKVADRIISDSGLNFRRDFLIANLHANAKTEMYFDDINLLAEEDEIVSLPSFIHRSIETYRNESPDIDLPRDIEIEYQTTVGHSVTLTQTVDTTKEIEANVSFSILDISGQSRFSFSRTVHVGEQTTRNYEETRRETIRINRTIPPCRALTYEVVSKHFKSRIPFSGRRKFDIRLEFNPFGSGFAGSPPPKAMVFLASDFFSEEERSAEISGFIDNIDNHSTEVVQKSEDIC